MNHSTYCPPTVCRLHGFRFYFTPLPRFFSPFPHGTSPLSVAREYLALGGGPPSFLRGSSCPVVLRVPQGAPPPFAYWTLTIYGGPFHAASARRLTSSRHLQMPDVTPATLTAQRLQTITCSQFGLFPLRSPLLGESSFLSLPCGTKMFQFPQFPSSPYGFR